MYPGISDILNDWFGTHFSVSFPPTFGTLVAISFLLAAWTLRLELARKAAAGLIPVTRKKILTGKGPVASEVFWNGIFGFVIGYKLLYAILNKDLFFSDPQGAILSTKGNIWGGIAGFGLLAYLHYRGKLKTKLAEPKLTEVSVNPADIVPEITMAAAFGGLLGAKIFHILEYWDDFIRDPAGMFFSGSGLTMYGGLIVGAVTTIYYGRKHHIRPLILSDAAAPGLMLAYGTGRLGCQLAGDGDWGIVNTAAQPGWLDWLPSWTWSYTYPHNVINEGVPIAGCEGHHCSQLAQGVFPTPLYESVICILLFFVLWKMRKRIPAPGVLFSWYLLFNGCERFMIEAIRVNSKYHVLGMAFTQAQLISTLLVITGIAGIVFFNRKFRRSPSA
ncbi:MAG: prolipoprotein diacylglyceryl transferase [Bacteroidia bacterium]|nr:prolipoprotein diacylglyceryl transferase [Bacteroidia bacterium]